MTDRRTLTIEVLAPIEDVWAALATADGWHVDGGGTTVEVASSRAPDRVTWHLAGHVRGEVAWELDDLDAVAFARSEWHVAPTHGRRPRPRRSRADHDRRAGEVAACLADRLGVELLLVRSDPRQPRVSADRAPRGAGPLLLGAMWLAGPSRRA